MTSEAASRDLPVPCYLQGLMMLNSGSFPSPGACIPLAENTPRQAGVCSSYFDIAHNRSQIDVEVELVYLRGSPPRYPTGYLEMEAKLGRKHRREARQPNPDDDCRCPLSHSFSFSVNLSRTLLLARQFIVTHWPTAPGELSVLGSSSMVVLIFTMTELGYVALV